MAKIAIVGPHVQYTTTIDPGPATVVIEEAYTGVKFVSAMGEELYVIERGFGFDVRYKAGLGVGFDSGIIEMRNGDVKRKLD